MPHFIHQSAELTVVEATQWLPGRAVAGVAGEAPGHPGGGGLLPVPPHAYLVTPRGRFTVFAHDWIVTEPTGRQQACSPEQFARLYAPLVEAVAE